MAMANKPGYGSHPEHNTKSNMGVKPATNAHKAVVAAAPGQLGPGDCPPMGK